MTINADPDALTTAEFVCRREALGLPLVWISQRLGVNPRTPVRWQSGASTVAWEAHQLLDEVADDTEHQCAELVASLRGMEEPELLSYRTDEDYWATKPKIKYPATWHRLLVVRAAAQVPGARVRWYQPPPRRRAKP